MRYNGANSYLFVNGTKIYKFKAKHSEIAASPLCLANISKDWSADNIKKTGFNGYVYDFSVDYDAALFWIFFTINAGIVTYFAYYKYMNRNKKMFLNIMIMFIKQKIINIKWEK